jgi:hypothetical protein
MKMHESPPTIPETLHLEDTDYEDFSVKNGDTDAGVYWYEYNNAAAKKLKKAGQFEWGKERLYFDIPLNSFEELRGLAFEVAKKEKIAIGFKYLDIEKTNKIDLRPESETTRFVANFASVEDAKRFYAALSQIDSYKKLHADREIEYQGFNIDGVAHYASGFREKREALARITAAQRDASGMYAYPVKDGSRMMKITEDQYAFFKNQLSALPDPKEVWEKTGE